MKKERLHYSMDEKIAMLKECMDKDDATVLAQVVDMFPFNTLKDVARIIARFGRGKET